ncbi:MAG: threonine synthase, partial [Oscillospiraceae bacterium]|nr:threonine synthase [Oscillospiraceae bacterium]
MKYYSTRNREEKITASQAIIKGLASDGGLYVPECFPQVNLDFVKELCALDYRERAAKIMSLFLEEFSEEELLGFCREAYFDNYDCTEAAPVRFTDDTTAFLELWHGPTCAFKDMALQMLPHLLSASLVKTDEHKTACILVATSGDTGKAAMEGFADVEQTKIMVFYPKDGVSAVQEA